MKSEKKSMFMTGIRMRHCRTKKRWK